MYIAVDLNFFRAASHCWQEGLGSLLGTKDVLNSWREVMRSTQSVFKKLTYQCLWIVVILAAKLAKYTCICIQYT